MALEYLIPYGLYFPVAADGIAAKAANGGTIDLGQMTPDVAAATYPTGIVLQLGPWIIYGLTGTPGVPAGAYADWQQGLGLSNITYAPTTRILTADATTNAIETLTATGQTYDLVAHWSGTIIYEGVVVAPAVGPPRPVSGRLQIQIISYTGDGTEGRLIPTTFSLAEVGSRVVVWVFPRGAGYSPIFRTNLAGMTGTAAIGSSTLDVTGPGGQGPIASFGAGGFVANKTANVSTRSANLIATKYTALVFCDTTSPARYIAVGSYLGRGVDHWATFSGVVGSPIGAGLFSLPSDTGRGFIVTLAPDIVMGFSNAGFIDAGHFYLTEVWKWGSGAYAAFVPGGGQVAALPFGPTAVWDFMGTTIFRTDDFTGDSSVTLSTAANVEAGQITGFAGDPLGPASIGYFLIGDASNQVNANGRTYYYAAFRIPAGDPARALFTTYKFTGTASAVDQVTGLELTPVFATARDISGSISEWRGPWHTGTDSESFAGGTVAAQGIRALGAGTIDLGTLVAAAGMDIYGWAMTGGAVAAFGDPQEEPPSPFDPAPSPDVPAPPPSTPPPNCPTPPPAATASGSACPTEPFL